MLFLPGKIRICHGFERNPTNFFIAKHIKSNNLCGILIENLQNDIVVRSRNCKFAFVEEEKSSETKKLICFECKLLRTNLSNVSLNKQQFSDNFQEENYFCDRRELHQRLENSFKETQLLKNSSDSKNFSSSIKMKKKISRKSTKRKRTISTSSFETKLCSVVLRPVPIEIIQKLAGIFSWKVFNSCHRLASLLKNSFYIRTLWKVKKVKYLDIKRMVCDICCWTNCIRITSSSLMFMLCWSILIVTPCYSLEIRT